MAAATAASDALSVLAKVGITSKAIPDAIADATAAVVAAASSFPEGACAVFAFASFSAAISVRRAVVPSSSGEPSKCSTPAPFKDDSEEEEEE